ncbi:MAG: hypothetical protein K6C36_05535 [Clostridia bacterium]|nr:hypothetical protein [Clostridia bacterium]
MKKITAVLLSALMLALLFPYSAFAAGTVTFVNTTRTYEQVDHTPYNPNRTDGREAYASVADANGETMLAAAYRFVAVYDEGFLVGYNADPDTAGENIDNNRLPRTVASGGMIYTPVQDASALYNPYIQYLYSTREHDYELYSYGNEYEAGPGRYLPVYLDGQGNADPRDLIGTETVIVPGSDSDPAYAADGDGEYTNDYSSKNYYSFGIVVGAGYEAQTMFVIANYGGEDHYLKKNSAGTYSVPTNQGDVTVRIDDSVLSRRTFLIPLTAGDGFTIQPYNKNDPSDPNYYATQYNGDFSFRLILKDDYSDANSVVIVQRANTGAEISTVDEILTAEGIDKDGNKIFTVHNVTTNILISVSLVMSNKMSNILTWFKRIIRLILSLFGVAIDNNFTETYTVKVVNNVPEAQFEFISGVLEGHTTDATVNVLSNTQVILKVTVPQSLVTAGDDLVTVTWTPGNEDGSAITGGWQINPGAEDSTFYKLFCISNITANTTITITGP